MMTKPFVKFLALFFLVTLSFFSNPALAGFQQLEFDLTSSKDININKINEVYQITTIGNDPYISTGTITEDYNPDEYHILSFDYQTADQINDLQFFYYDPQVISEAGSIHLEFLPITDNSWRTHNIDLKSFNPNFYRGYSR
jgi:hypothetical protein